MSRHDDAEDMRATMARMIDRMAAASAAKTVQVMIGPIDPTTYDCTRVQTYATDGTMVSIIPARNAKVAEVLDGLARVMRAVCLDHHLSPQEIFQDIADNQREADELERRGMAPGGVA